MIKDPICGMSVDAKSSLKLAHGAETVYFCSQHCLEKYAKIHALNTASSCAAPGHRKPWFLNKSVLSFSAILVLILLSYRLPSLTPFRENVFMYFGVIWWAVLLGFFLGGILERYVPREYISHLLARRKKRTILSSVCLGFLMSACSHGILALSMELYKKGASTSVVVSFLLASPWANLPITLMLIGFFGLKALYIILGALGIALVTGLLFQKLEKKGWVETNPHTLVVGDDYSVIEDIQKRARGYRFSIERLREDAKAVMSGAVALADMTLWWVLIGVALSGLLAAFVPHAWFHQFLGPSVLGLLATLVLATIMEVCSEGTAPLAFEIFKQTGAFGNAFVFLMAGVVTDITEIGLVWSNIGRKTAIWIPAIAVPQVVILGFIANHFFR